MGSIAELHIDNLHLSYSKNDVDPMVMVLFKEQDKNVFECRPSELIHFSVDDDESGSMTAFQYSCSISNVKDRLALLGFNLSKAQKEYAEAHKRAINEEISWGFGNKTEDDGLTTIQQLDLAKWTECIKFIHSNKIDFYDEKSMDKCDELSRNLLRKNDCCSLCPFEGLNFYNYLRLILEACADDDELVYDLSHLYGGGWVDVEDDLTRQNENMISDEAILSKPIIILAEGKTDIRNLELALSFLYPHLVDYFYFLDFYKSKAKGGNQLFLMVKSLFGAGIPNRIIALFDNDSAGAGFVSQLKKLQIPSNIVIMQYPNMESFKDYPAIENDSPTRIDINGIGASIEMYLDNCCLRNSENDRYPVEKGGYINEAKEYQWALSKSDKKQIQKRADKHFNQMKCNKNYIQNFDWSGLRAIWESIMTSFQ